MTDAPPVALRAEIDLGAIRHNVRRLAEAAGEDEVMGVAKADAYGHGAVPVARVLVGEGVRRLAVATIPEAVELREAGIDVSILVLAAPLDAYLDAYAAHNLEAVVSSPEVADAIRQRGGLTVHVKVDTGMHRIGVAPEEAAGVVRQLQEAPDVTVAALWTHLATADAAEPGFSLEQVRRFDGVLRDLGRDVPPLVHVANGPSLVRLPRLTSHRALVRLGGVLYGLASSQAMTPDVADLRPAMRLVTRVVHLQIVAPGESVSYGRTWTADRPTRIATLAAGYADGLPRGLSNAGTVGIGGQLWPIVGRVCMDMLMVSLGDPEGPSAEIRRGDEAVLFGTGGPSALDAAESAGTIPYELTSGLTARVARLYADGA